MIVLLGDTAVDKSKFFDLNATESSRTKSVKPCFSSVNPLLHSVCQQTVYMINAIYRILTIVNSGENPLQGRNWSKHE